MKFTHTSTWACFFRVTANGMIISITLNQKHGAALMSCVNLNLNLTENHSKLCTSLFTRPLLEYADVILDNFTQYEVNEKNTK